MTTSNIFLVGGAVRDKFLDCKINEFDWLVVNTNPGFMLQSGFKRVGKDFPVFLHPVSKEEFSIARKEKKVGKGYYGFKCDFSVYVSLSEDLFRRDLSINSIILTENGLLIDFFSGISDLKNKRISHVSFAFFEDPLRVLRVFRFFVKYYYFNFKLSIYILSFVRKVILSGELLFLSYERIFKEIFLSLQYENCFLYFYFLYESFILDKVFYDLNLLFILSKQLSFNIYLNFITHLCKIFNAIHFFTNNLFVKFALLFYRLTFNILFHNNFCKIFSYNKKSFLLVHRYISVFNLSKRYVNFLVNLTKFRFFFFNLLYIKKYYFFLFFLKINSFKDKITVINYIMISDIDSLCNDKIYNFYFKYILLDMLNLISKKNQNLFDNILLKRTYIINMYAFFIIEKVKKFYKKNKVY